MLEYEKTDWIVVHKRVLFFVLLVSLLYVFGVVYFNKPKDSSGEFRFLYILDKKSLTVIAKFPKNKVAKELVSTI